MAARHGGLEFTMTSHEQLEKIYDPRSVEPAIYAAWEQAGAFRSIPDGRPHEQSYTIVIPPPNVTGALHLGHALNNTLQDILIRYHRMRGFNTLWQPGTDHAGIATQAVVERRIREQEGKNRFQLGATEQESREELVRRIWQWKDEYEKRILSQLKLMGCSCDWERNRFTLDEGLARAVRHMFFMLFRDGLIFRGKRLVNWDTQLQTAVSDDEVYHETVKGHFWHIKYPLVSDEATKRRSDGGEIDNRQSTIDNHPSIAQTQDDMATFEEPGYVVIATTRPETMLGDVAVAVHPDPQRFFEEKELLLQDEFRTTIGKEQQAAKDKLEALAARRDSHLPLLMKLAEMARAGRKLRLPLVDRIIPLIADEWADPTLGTGCVKITPAHDPNDYNVGLRHNLPMINVLTPDGKIAAIMEPDAAAAPCKPGSAENVNSEKYAGLSFSTEGRAKVVADLEAGGFLDHVEDRDIELGHSDRSKLPIEPYLSDQWFVRTAEATERRSDEATKGKARDREQSRISDHKSEISNFKSSGLAQAAMDAVTGGRIQVFPSRYAKSYLDWLGEKRDWCISRQLWWGHRVPVWTKECSLASWFDLWSSEPFFLPTADQPCLIEAHIEGGQTLRFRGCLPSVELVAALRDSAAIESIVKWTICCDERIIGRRISQDTSVQEVRFEDWLDSNGFQRDPDVLDTWFSSALWPFSTLGWPEETPHLKQYYPGSVLCTSRDIITNWVARMVMFGQFAMGEVPFDHVYIHPKILDGRGETMSKSKGNGVDPVDIIHTHGADAMRYTLADMTTETQDIRMPVEYVCPHCGGLTDQGAALKAEEQNRKSRGQKLERKLQPADCHRVKCAGCAKLFATQWADAATKQELALARETSDKFEIGRNFCNKLWNAARYAFINLATERRSDEATEGNVEKSKSQKVETTASRGTGVAGTAQEAALASLLPEDRWILARLSQTIRRYHQLIGQYQFAASVKELRDFFWDSLCDWYIELTKARLSGGGRDQGESDEATERRSDEGGIDNRQSTIDNRTESPDHKIAQSVLAFCMDQVLRLWHPTIPFITERLWRQLNEIVPHRGLPGLVAIKHSPLLIHAEFPPVDGYPTLDDSEILATFAALQDATRGVRELRTSANLPPKERPTVTVIVPPDRLSAFTSQAHIVRHMAGIGELHIASQGQRPPNAAALSLGSLRIFIHDISDDAAEKTRSGKALEDVVRQITSREAKLSNEKFVANAKPEVVEAERQRLAELVAQRDSLQAHLAELSA